MTDESWIGAPTVEEVTYHEGRTYWHGECGRSAVRTFRLKASILRNPNQSRLLPSSVSGAVGVGPLS